MRTYVRMCVNTATGAQGDQEMSAAQRPSIGDGLSSQRRPSSSRPLDFGRCPPHCLKKNATSSLAHASRRSRTHSGSIRRWPGPDSPPAMSQSMPSRLRPSSGPEQWLGADEAHRGMDRRVGSRRGGRSAGSRRSRPSKCSEASQARRRARARRSWRLVRIWKVCHAACPIVAKT